MYTNVKIYKRLFMSAKCSYCGAMKICADIFVVEDPGGKMEICQDCYKKLFQPKVIGGVK